MQEWIPIDARQLDHLQHLLAGGAVVESVANMQAQPFDVEVGSGNVEGGVDELLYFRLQRPLTQGTEENWV